MAPTLTSNSFLLTTTPHSRLTLKNPRFTVFAKKSENGIGPFPSFRFGKASDGSSSEETGEGNSNPFRFDFGKLPDAKSLIPVSSTGGFSFGVQRRKDPGTVFVAGATGQSGIRIARTLLREGFIVRAGVPDLGAAQELALLAARYKIISGEESKRLNSIESTFQDAESIAKSIGNASKVVVTIGPAENGPTAEVTISDALQVIQAAQLAGVGHVAIVYDGSVTASTYNVLDGLSSFFNNLFSRSQPLTITEVLQEIVQTNVSYTLIKATLTDDFSPERSYNITVSAEGNGSDYKVTKSQIASLVANVFSNIAVAENKVVEVSSDPSAPSRPVFELFSSIPEDGRRKAYAEAIAKAKAEEEAKKATEKASEAAKAAKKLEDQEARSASLAKEAQEKVATAGAGASVESLLNKAKGISTGLSWEKFSSQLKSAAQKSTEESIAQIATIRGQAKAQNLPAQKAAIKQLKQRSPPKPREVPKSKPKQTESETEVKKIFGGLFQQETIYVDD